MSDRRVSNEAAYIHTSLVHKEMQYECVVEAVILTHGSQYRVSFEDTNVSFLQPIISQAKMILSLLYS